MSLVDTITKEMISAMKAREPERLSTLRMIKSAFKNREIEKRAPLEDPEAVQVLTTMIKQRRESIEAFTKGNRPALAAKEAEEIRVIETFMPKAASEEEIRAVVAEALAELTAAGTTLGPKDIGVAMKAVQAKIQAGGIRADGRTVSEVVKGSLSQPIVR
ncbi:MAG TPA: GatB/YqeY domain-containing protein [Acidisarcina sp.]